MVITSDQRSLYEDWQLRRERLLIDSKVIEQYREMQLQLLDYLLRRYRDAAAVQRPARFPLPTELTLNERAIVVHHHLWPGQISGTKSIFDMNRRVSGIVDRMNRVSPEVEDSPPADDAENKYSALEAASTRHKINPGSIRRQSGTRFGGVGIIEFGRYACDRDYFPPLDTAKENIYGGVSNSLHSRDATICGCCTNCLNMNAR